MANVDANLLVRQMTGAPVALALPPISTVAHLKKLLHRKTSVAVDAQRIVFSGRELDNQRPLSFYGIAAGGAEPSVMHLVLKTKGMRVFVKTLKDVTFAVDCDATSTVLEVKHRVAEQDSQWDVLRQRIILHGKELEDKSRLSECGLDDETPTVHLVMRLPAPGTARRKREPASSSKEAGATGANSVGARITQGPKVKNEPVQEDDLAAMSFAGMRQLSDMLVDGDAMEFDQAWQQYEQESAATPVWDVEAGLGPSTPKPVVALPGPATAQDSKLLDNMEINSFLAPCPGGPGSACSPKAAENVLVAQAVLVSDSAVSSASEEGVVGAGGASLTGAVTPKALESVDIDADCVEEASTVPSTQGRAYDLNKVDEKLRKRLLKNRLSAERSRQRKQAHVEALEFELSCCRSENEHLKKRVATLEAQVASLSLNSLCKPAQSFGHHELTAVS